MKIQGMYAAAATPFDHTGALYRVKVQHNFEKWSRTSLAGFIIGSLAGEGPLLSASEKLEILRLAVPRVPADRTIVMDVSAEGVHAAVCLARAAAEAGAHAVVSLVPHQYRNLMYGPETQMLYFRALADQSGVPVLIHNAPQMTGVDVLPETTAKLAAHPNIAGVIETGSPASRVAQIRSLTTKEFGILAGTESQVWESLKLGANGAAITFASAAPYATIAIWEAFRTREEEAGVDWQGRISHPSILITDMYGVPGLKHAMDINGYYGGPPRLPFVPVSQDARVEIEEAFRDLKG
ncbi:MAG TPA: dihydrodipicolinate synthase family protein [Bryobacteraceae bacterium]|jgi:4-hydroxy-2-oxoglutarate aldolase|nr:dihydrodipicolinate synthase family protein [Bryobacteraceae bacterium]